MANDQFVLMNDLVIIRFVSFCSGNALPRVAQYKLSQGDLSTAWHTLTGHCFSPGFGLSPKMHLWLTFGDNQTLNNKEVYRRIMHKCRHV